MRYIFVGKITHNPGPHNIGKFAYHEADCDERGIPILEGNEINHLNYGLGGLQDLKESLRKFEDFEIINGIPLRLFRKFVPDKDYIMGNLSEEEFVELKDQKKLEDRVA